MQLTVQALKAAAAAGGIVLQNEVGGRVSYVRRDAMPRVVEATPPAEYTALLETMPALVRMSRFLDPNGACACCPPAADACGACWLPAGCPSTLSTSAYVLVHTLRPPSPSTPHPPHPVPHTHAPWCGYSRFPIVTVVTEVSGELISQLANGVRVHVENPALATPMCLALTKLCEHPNNAVAVADTSIIQTLSMMLPRVTADEATAEVIASLLRPLSIITEVCA